jgi:Phytanoyl-CoA dioxygenase (PhyH)
VNEHARQIVERGYTVFERAYDPAWVDEIRTEIEEIYRELGSPEPYAKEPRRIAPDAELCVAGLAVHHLVARRPRFAESLFRPEIISAIRAAIGEDAELEVAGCVISDAARPFFGWHTHAGTENDDAYRHTGNWPHFERAERVMTLLYLDDLAPDNAPVLVYPRRAGEPVAPPQDPELEEWEGQVEIACPKGSLLALEQCTWHAVRHKTSPGLRIYVCCTLASPRAGRAVWRDDSLTDLSAGGELFQSLLPKKAP